ncbi:hypothetical protein CCR75_004551 [Bremia lactucae]|uniref:Importin N-terminal domain-containing protein n=1 Tax=Bremia lactucae TaxID=4779 RepID=A0A976NXY6_BRELC|nr:hypothetical protein CCR75_004551 [Bremia lactucae]
MAEQLSACARQLFEGVSGSNEQCAANAWLIQFQTRKEAWQAALELLENPVRDPQTQQILAAPELVAMQILRLKTQYEWAHINEAQQQVVLKTLLKLLETTCVTNAGLSSVCCRIACVTVADIIVKSCKTQTEWKSDVLRLVDAGIAVQRQQKGASILAEIYGAIPHQIQALEKQWVLQDMQAMLVTFQGYGEDVMTAVLWILTSIPVEKSNALRCLESWIVGCVPTHETFGLSASHLFPRGLLDVLFAIAFRDTEQGQLAAEIIAESFVCTPSEVSNMTEAVLYSSRRLLEAMPFLRGEIGLLTNEAMTKEQQTSVCRCMSRIACSLAIHHGRALFEHQISTTIAHFGSDKQMHFSIEFLEFLLACSSYDDIDVVQPTLEIWFFFLDNYSFQSKVKCQHLHATQNERVLSILSRLVSSLIDRCKYPQWFIQRQQLVSDDPDIEAITDLRREIADTLLSLFSKWPGGLGKPAGDYVSCVKEMCLLLSDSKDIAQIDALLFLLAYMVELFDAVSSDSEPEDDVHSIQKPEFCGMSVLLGILDCAANLPMHPLVINGVARYLRSLSTSHALQSNVYLRFSIIICQGLQYPSSFSLAAQSLLRCSTHLSLVRYKLAFYV